MDGQYGLLFLLALKRPASRDCSAKAEDAYYACFGESPRRRLARLFRSLPLATRRSEPRYAEAFCSEPQSPAVGGIAAETNVQAVPLSHGTRKGA